MKVCEGLRKRLEHALKSPVEVAKHTRLVVELLLDALRAALDQHLEFVLRVLVVPVALKQFGDAVPQTP